MAGMKWAIILFCALTVSLSWRLAHADETHGREVQAWRQKVRARAEDMRQHNGTWKADLGPGWLAAEGKKGALYFPIGTSAVRSALRDNLSDEDLEALHHSFPRRQLSAVAVDKASTSSTEEIPLTVGGSFQSSADFFVTVALGTSSQIFDVVLDTGSFLFWVQCDCIQGGCEYESQVASNLPYPVHTPFNTAASSSDAPLACTSSLCTNLTNEQGGNYFCSSAGSEQQCAYIIPYGDGSQTEGTIFTDVLPGLPQTPSVPFGCSDNSSSSFTDGNNPFDGIMGFGYGQETVVSSLVSEGLISNTFSVCLEGESTGGHLVLGRTSTPSGMQFAAIGPDQNGHIISHFTSITFGSTAITLSSAISSDMVIDTGTSTTLLPSATFESLANTVFNALPNTYTSINYYQQFNAYCAVAPSYLTYAALSSLLPPLVIAFTPASSSAAASYNVPPWDYMQQYASDRKYYLCLVATGVSGQSASYLMGGPWLRDHDVIFDYTVNTMGFIDVNCTTGDALNLNATAGSEVITFPSNSTTGSGSPPSSTAAPPPPSTSSISSPPPPSSSTPSGASRRVGVSTSVAVLVGFATFLLMCWSA